MEDVGSPTDELSVVLHFRMRSDAEQDAFLAAYRPVVAEHVAGWPGFLGATLYVSTDGTRVINHTRWTDASAYRTFLERSDAEARMAAIERAFSSVEGLQGPDMTVTHTYRPREVVLPAASAPETSSTGRA